MTEIRPRCRRVESVVKSLSPWHFSPLCNMLLHTPKYPALTRKVSWTFKKFIHLYSITVYNYKTKLNLLWFTVMCWYQIHLIWQTGSEKFYLSLRKFIESDFKTHKTYIIIKFLRKIKSLQSPFIFEQL